METVVLHRWRGGGGGGGGKRAGVLQNNLVLSTESVMLAPVNSF